MKQHQRRQVTAAVVCPDLSTLNGHHLFHGHLQLGASSPEPLSAPSRSSAPPRDRSGTYRRRRRVHRRRSLRCPWPAASMSRRRPSAERSATEAAANPSWTVSVRRLTRSKEPGAAEPHIHSPAGQLAQASSAGGSTVDRDLPHPTVHIDLT